jgi:hypothetical protein
MLGAALILNCSQASVDGHRPGGRRLLKTPLGTLSEVSRPLLLRGPVTSEEASAAKALGANRMQRHRGAAINPLLDDQVESRSGLGRGVQQDQVEVENPYGSQRETPPIYWTV